MEGRKQPTRCSNKMKPEGNRCPKCQGFYDWGEGLGRCVCCGFHWNPPIEPKVIRTPHCAYKCCLVPIPSYERVYCPKHEREIVDEQAWRNLARQKAYVRKFGGHYDTDHIRLSVPIMVKQRPEKGVR